MATKDQYISWQSLQDLRAYWVRIGHKLVHPINCSCGFKGEGKPENCTYKIKVSEAN